MEAMRGLAGEVAGGGGSRDDGEEEGDAGLGVVGEVLRGGRSGNGHRCRDQEWWRRLTGEMSLMRIELEERILKVLNWERGGWEGLVGGRGSEDPLLMTIRKTMAEMPDLRSWRGRRNLDGG